MNDKIDAKADRGKQTVIGRRKCTECFHCKQRRVTNDNGGRSQKIYQVSCTEDNFDPSSVEKPFWMPTEHLDLPQFANMACDCDDFSGFTKPRNRRTVNLANVLPSRLMAAIYRYIPNGGRVIIPKQRGIGEAERKQVIDVFDKLGSKRKTAQALHMKESRVREILQEEDE